MLFVRDVACARCVERGYGVIRRRFTKRSDSVGSHKGQVSFPGGRRERGESAIDAALRETKEEVGLDASDIEVVATLNDAYSYYGDIVTPVVGIVHRSLVDLQSDIVDYHNRFAPLVVAAAEIDDVMFVPLRHLCDTR